MSREFLRISEEQRGVTKRESEILSRLALEMILSLKRFEIQFLESLILAQDERWRRA